VIVEVLLLLLYVAVIMLAPTATPLIGTAADINPAGTVTVAGTVTAVGAELVNAIVAAALGADDSSTVNDPTPFTPIIAVVGLRALTTGFVGVVPSVVN